MDKRRYDRKKVITHADLVYKKHGTGIKKYFPVWIIDRSKNGFRISSRNFIPVVDLVGIRFNFEGKEDYETVKFAWLKKLDKKYFMGLRITRIY